MKKIFTHFVIAAIFLSMSLGVSAQQIIQLYYEDFNGGTAGFSLNSATGPSSNTGPNQWIINSEYNGNVLYPNTPDEDQTVSGTIAGAPISNYLHVYDSNNGATASNANYDPNTASDRMAVMNSSFCTLGLIDVTLTFFYIGEGNANDYAQLYFSTDGGGSWIQTGMSQYNNQSLWKYEVVTNPAFNNVQDLRFAWRWKNGTGAAKSIGFGVDDIIVVGTYDEINNPVDIVITSVTNPVCQGAYIIIYWELSAPLCDGIYEILLSNSTGSFSNPTSLGVFTIYSGTTSGGIAAVAPSNANGDCYEVKIVRVSPPPTITGSASICFTIEECPNVITTLQPPVTFGPDTLCNYSVIDVPFYSTGVYFANNVYTAELSDEFGSFASPTVLGSSPDPKTYDPALGSLPGSVSGLVPDVPEGCGYLVRVVSSNPVAIGSPWGPFCIHHCDVTTNNMQDIQVCISDYVGADSLLNIDIGTWSPPSTYNPGNIFKIEILSSSTYQLINTGSLGQVAATGSTTCMLSIPGLIDLIPILGAPGYGTYYMRFSASDPNPKADSLGTLVHLSIGYIDSSLYLIPSDTAICAGAISSIMPLPYSPNYQYQWWAPPFFNVPTVWPYWPLYIDWSGVPAGVYPFSCRPIVNGCYGPWSDTVWITVQTIPSSAIIGPISVCIGDTVKYFTPFIPGTYYDWTTSLVDIIDTSNNEITVVFTAAGTANLSVFALNNCGSNNGSKNITVHDVPTILAPADTGGCPGTLITLLATSNGTTYKWYGDDVFISSSNPISVYPADTVIYTVMASNTYGCENWDTTVVIISPEMGLFVKATDVTCYGYDDGTALAIGFGGTPPFSYSWDTSPISTDFLLDSLPGGWYSVTITDANGCSIDTSLYVSTPNEIYMSAYAQGVSQNGLNDGSAYVIVSGGSPSYNYEWSTSPPQYTEAATGLGAGIYIVTVTDSRGCLVIDTVEVKDAVNVFAVPNVFTPNGDGTNDIFNINEVNVNSMQMKVFNRWGQMIFLSTNLANGWDGKFDGVPQPIETYVYEIKVTFIDGTYLEKKGNLTLLR